MRSAYVTSKNTKISCVNSNKKSVRNETNVSKSLKRYKNATIFI